MLPRAQLQAGDDGEGEADPDGRTFKRIRRSSPGADGGAESPVGQTEARSSGRRERLVYWSGSSEGEGEGEGEDANRSSSIDSETVEDEVVGDVCMLGSSDENALLGCCMRVSVLEEEMAGVCEQLTCVPRSMHGFLHEPVEMFLRVGRRSLLVPRFFGVSSFGWKPWRALELPAGEPPSSSSSSRWRFCGQLNPLQEEAVAACLQSYDKDRGGVLSLFCGAGKTVCALWLVCRLRRKTLIVVHKSFLCDQWAERARRFAPDLRVGILRQDRVETEGKDLVIAMLQSLVTRDSYPLSDFDHIIFDECHHICARAFSRALFKIGCTHSTGDVCVLGLSATPHRRDGLTPVLHWFLGPTAYEASYSPARAGDVSVICIGVAGSSSLSSAGGLAEMVTSLTEMPERNRIVAREVEQAWREGRKILLLSDRRAHLETLQGLLARRDRRMGKEIGFYVGGRTSGELRKASSCCIILATYSMCSEGLDIPSLNTLILATPRADIAQSIGRILRAQEEETRDLCPKIVDLMDVGVHARFAKMAERRKKLYRSSGFNVLQYCCESEDELPRAREEDEEDEEGDEREERAQRKVGQEGKDEDLQGLLARSLRYCARRDRTEENSQGGGEEGRAGQTRGGGVELRTGGGAIRPVNRGSWMQKTQAGSGWQAKTCPHCSEQFSGFFQHTCK